MLPKILSSILANKFFFPAIGIILLISISAITVQTLRISALSAELETSKILISTQTETIAQMEKTQKLFLEVTAKLRKQQSIATAQRLKNQKELSAKLKKLGMTTMYNSRLRCLELSSGSTPRPGEPSNEFCPQYFKEK